LSGKRTRLVANPDLAVGFYPDLTRLTTALPFEVVDGVLHLSLPKAEEARPKLITVKAK
jgi:hypothetical protein